MRIITDEEMQYISGGGEGSFWDTISNWFNSAADYVGNFVGLDGQFGWQDHSGNTVGNATLYVTGSVAADGAIGPIAQVTVPINGEGTVSVGAGVGTTGVSFSNQAVVGLDVSYGSATYNVPLDASGGNTTIGFHHDASDAYYVDFGVMPGSMGPNP